MKKVSAGINWRVLLVGLITVALIGCASAPPDRIPEDPQLDTYVIGIPDLLRVKVWEQPDISGDVLVRRDGKISVALMGDAMAAGKTPEELARLIEKGLAQFVSVPRVDVAVVEMRSQVVSVIGGGIESSGVLELRNDMRVIDAIAEMGGLTPFAKKSDIRVLRGEESYPFDYRAFMRGKAPQSNFLLAPGDTIIVPE
ncbi:MAG: polysaccharide biosynthesis/export family protein [Halioglobus sp.]